MEDVALEQFRKFKPSIIATVLFISHLLDESDQDASTTATLICVNIHFFIHNGFTLNILTTMLYHMDICTEQYNCASDIYILSWLTLELCIIIDRADVASVHVKDIADVNNPI